MKTNTVTGEVSVISTVTRTQRFHALVKADGKYAKELETAVSRGENPAEALMFLAHLAVIHLNPHYCELLNSTQRSMWEKYFGKQ